MNHIKYTSAIVLALCSATAVAQQKRISGHVFNAKDGAVVMANVVEKDKTNRVVSATQTDMSGNFSMTSRTRTTVLKFPISVIPPPVLILSARARRSVSK